VPALEFGILLGGSSQTEAITAGLGTQHRPRAPTSCHVSSYADSKLRSCDLVRLRIRDVCHGNVASCTTHHHICPRPKTRSSHGVGFGKSGLMQELIVAHLAADEGFTELPTKVVKRLLGCTKVGGTARYLGIEVDDTLEISEQPELWRFDRFVGRWCIRHRIV